MRTLEGLWRLVQVNGSFRSGENRMSAAWMGVEALPRIGLLGPSGLPGWLVGPS